VLGSDHAPHTLEEKAKPYPASPSGMTGRADAGAVMLDHVAAGRLTLERFVDLTSAGPARSSASPARAGSRSATTPTSPIVDLKRRRDDHQRLDRLALRLDALRRHDGHRLAGRHDRPRPPGDVGRRRCCHSPQMKIYAATWKSTRNSISVPPT
jgi:hypothetical protein